MSVLVVKPWPVLAMTENMSANVICQSQLIKLTIMSRLVNIRLCRIDCFINLLTITKSCKILRIRSKRF